MKLKLVKKTDWDGNDHPGYFIVGAEDWGSENSIVAHIDPSISDYRPEDMKKIAEEMCESYNRDEVYFVIDDSIGYSYIIHGIYTDKKKAERIAETKNKESDYEPFSVETHKINQKIHYMGYVE